MAAVFFLLAIFAAAQDNPFFSGSEPTAKPPVSSASGLFQDIVNGVVGLQRDLNARLSELSRSVTEEGNAGVFFILLAAAFGYGLVHALGPGHGKVVMASYALANPLKAKQGVLLGAGVAVVHTLSAVVLVTALYLILNSSYQAYGGMPKKIITLVGYGLIAGMGALLLVRAVFRLRRPGRGDAISPQTEAPAAAGKTRELVLPALLMGMVPCEGAVLILVFSLSIDAFWLGICLSAVMSAGMAVTISVVGLLALGAKKGTAAFLSKRKNALRILTSLVQLSGAAVIMMFGAALFAGGLW